MRGVINRGLAEQIRDTFLGRILGLRKGKARKARREKKEEEEHRSTGFICFLSFITLLFLFDFICALAMTG